MYNCKFCGKECKSEHSLKAHQAVCKLNENRYNIVPPKGTGFKKGTKKWVYKDDETKLVSINEIDNYLNDGWSIGMDTNFKKHISDGLIGHSKGRANNEKDEINRKKNISNSMKGNKNWIYNKTRGNGKKGWYHGIFCDSMWELAFLVYYIDNGLNIKRCQEKRTYLYNGEKHIYLPDFVTDEGIIEIKGRFNEKAIEKSKQNPDVIVYDIKKMKFFIEYATKKYGKDFYKVLYDK